MALLERVSTLVRANLNDLIDRAEHPEKMIKQVMLDMQNQLMQVKTQVAIAIADEHLLLKKQKENEDKVAEWMRKAELAVDKKHDDLARASLQRVESYRDLSDGFGQQVIDQKAQVENLKTALRQLETTKVNNYSAGCLAGAFPEIRQYVAGAIEEAIKGKPAAEALKDAKVKADAALDRYNSAIKK